MFLFQELKVPKKDGEKKTQGGTQAGKAGAPKKSTFVPPQTILDFETIHRFLSLLLR